MKLKECKVGDKVRRKIWDKAVYIEIWYKGYKSCFCRDNKNSEDCYYYGYDDDDWEYYWEHYKEPEKGVGMPEKLIRLNNFDKNLEADKINEIISFLEYKEESKFTDYLP